MRGATAEDWLNFVNFQDLVRNVYLYEYGSKTARHPMKDDLPWPVVWVLARYHKKHIWASGKQPNLDWIRRNLVDFRNKLCWRWLFRHKPAYNAGFRIVKRRKCTHYHGDRNDSLECWLQGLAHCLLQVGARSRSRASANKSFANLLPITRLGLKLLRDSGRVAVPTDKDGGYAIVKGDDLTAIHNDILKSDMYVEIPRDSIDEVAVKNEYFRLCGVVDKLEGARGQLAPQMRRTFGPDTSLFCKLHTTVKTHKPQGAIGNRNIHAATRFKLEGLSAWVDKVLAGTLYGRHNHLLTSTGEFVEKIAKVKAKEEHIMYRIDVDHFFMSGAAQDLSSDASAVLPPGPFRDRFVEVVRFLLDNQYVESKRLPDATFKVECGTGMGLRHSGAIADAALHELAERHFAADAAVHEHYGIDAFFRFRDDVFILGCDEGKATEFIHQYSTRAQYFKTSLEDKSYECVRFLEVAVSKNLATKRYDVTPTFKKTSLGRPLGADSAHPPATRQWPVARIDAYDKISSNPQLAMTAKELFINRFLNFYAPSYLVDRMRNATVTQGPRNQRQHTTNRNGNVIWLVLSYHPAWDGAGLKRALRDFQQDAANREILKRAFGTDDVPVVCVAWKNKLPTATLVVRKCDPVEFRYGRPR